MQCQGWQQSQLLTYSLQDMASTSWNFNLMETFCIDEVRVYKVVNSCMVGWYFSRDEEQCLVINKPESFSDLFFIKW